MAEEQVICISSDENDDSADPATKGSFRKRKCSDANTEAALKHLKLDNSDANRAVKDENSADEEKPQLSTLKNSTYDDVVPSMSKENSDPEPPSKDNKVLPSLVIKEKKILEDEQPRTVFDRFVDTCKRKDGTREMDIIIDKLRSKYNKLDPTYANSPYITTMLNEKMMQINSSGKVYLRIREVKEIYKQALRIKQGNVENGAEVGEVNEETEEERKKRKKISKIVKTIDLIEKKIKQLDEAEVDWDEEENGAYLKVARYKKRIVELHQMLCKETGDAPDAMREFLKPKRLSPSGILAVDQAITSFVYSKVLKRNRTSKSCLLDAINIPEYLDILKCVQQCNKEQQLNISPSEEKEKAIAAFKNVGEHLKRLRNQDYWDTFSVYLDNNHEDPGEADAELMAKLSANRKTGDANMEKVCTEFVRLQESRVAQQSEENNEGSEEQRNSVDEDEDEDEDSDTCENEEAGDDSNDDEEKKKKVTGGEKPKIQDSSDDATNPEMKSSTNDSEVISDSVVQEIPTKIVPLNDESTLPATNAIVQERPIISSVETLIKPLIRIKPKPVGISAKLIQVAGNMDLSKAVRDISKSIPADVPSLKTGKSDLIVETNGVSKSEEKKICSEDKSSASSSKVPVTSNSKQNSNHVVSSKDNEADEIEIIDCSSNKVKTGTSQKTDQNQVFASLRDSTKAGEEQAGSDAKPTLRVKTFAKLPEAWNKSSPPKSNSESNSEISVIKQRIVSPGNSHASSYLRSSREVRIVRPVVKVRNVYNNFKINMSNERSEQLPSTSRQNYVRQSNNSNIRNEKPPILKKIRINNDQIRKNVARRAQPMVQNPLNSNISERISSNVMRILSPSKVIIKSLKRH